LILPVTRPVFRRLLTGFVTRRVVVSTLGSDPGRRPGAGPQGPVVRGDVVEPPD
jgi:UPF0716 protein FxsA